MLTKLEQREREVISAAQAWNRKPLRDVESPLATAVSAYEDQLQKETPPLHGFFGWLARKVCGV